MKDKPMLVQLQDVTEGGGFAQGECVYFDGTTVDGRDVRITIPTDAMSLFFQQLPAFTALAIIDRGGDASDRQSGGPQATALPIEGFGVHSTADGSAVVLRVHIGTGLHNDVPIPTEHIGRLAASLQKQAAKARKISKTKLH